jgi:DnaK suppressor protein
MDKQKLDHFRELLLRERQRTEALLSSSATAVDEADADVRESDDLARADVDKELAFSLRQRETHQLHEIDDALRRIEEGTYGICERCGKPIEEARLEAMPSTRYHARCQAEIEAAEGIETPTL